MLICVDIEVSISTEGQSAGDDMYVRQIQRRIDVDIAVRVNHFHPWDQMGSRQSLRVEPGRCNVVG